MASSTTNLHVNDIIGYLIEVGRELILKSYKPNSCIASSRIAIEVLDYFGFDCYPVELTTRVYNRKFTSLLAERKSLPDDGTLNKWKQQGAWSVGLGFNKNINTWEGHVGVIVEDIMLLDLSIDQANSEEHDVKLKPLSAIVTKDFINMKSNFCCVAQNCLLDYNIVEQTNVYKASSNWKVDGINKHIIGSLIKDLKGKN